MWRLTVPELSGSAGQGRARPAGGSMIKPGVSTPFNRAKKAP